MPLAKSTQDFVQKMIDASNPFGIDIRTLGCKVGEDISKIINKYILSQPVDSFINLFIPPGVFYITQTIYRVDRVVNIRGAGRGITILYVASGQSGIWIDRKKGLSFDDTLQDFTMVALAKVIPGISGIKIWNRAIVRNVEVQGFSDCGIRIDGFATGKPEDDAAHNASFSKVYDCFIAANGSDGVLVDGSDANACLIQGNDIRNNGGWAIRDSGFLGSTCMNCMAHANGKGAYTVDHPNAVGASWIGGYVEGDNPLMKVWRANKVESVTGNYVIKYQD